MKIPVAASLIGILLLAACGNDGGEGNGGETSVEENEQAETATSTEAEEETLTAEEIMESAIAFYDDLDGLYFVVEGEIDVDQDEEQENMPEGEVTTTTRETQWDYIENGDYYTRLELDMMMEGEEEGGPFSEEEPTTYQFSDIADPNYTINYEEGDEEAIRYETGANTEDIDLTAAAGQYETLLEEAELTYVGEEEVNGYQTYHIEAEQDGDVSEHWFDQETYYEIKYESEPSSEEEEAAGDPSSNIEVVDYERNPDFDESLFEAPDDIEVVDGEIGDTIGN